MRELKVYRFINSDLIEQLAQQFGLPLGADKSTESEFGLGIKILNARNKRVTKAAPLKSNDPRLVEAVVDALRDRGYLRIFRPETYVEYRDDERGPWFVHERGLSATPVTVPLPPSARALNTPDAVTVWISDPLPLRGEPLEYEFNGSFLFLVQELREDPEKSASMVRSGMSSGVSALRAIVDYLVGFDEQSAGSFGSESEGEDRFGRWSFRHPIEKLRDVGGLVGMERTIESVYKIRYMTNEQAYTVGGKETRVNDILAYPLYIAE